jgi:hypothetical protein
MYYRLTTWHFAYRRKFVTEVVHGSGFISVSIDLDKIRAGDNLFQVNKVIHCLTPDNLKCGHSGVSLSTDEGIGCEFCRFNWCVHTKG